MCNEVREAFPLDWDNCVKYSSNNANSMIVQCNSLLQNIQSVQSDQKIFDVTWFCHLAQFCYRMGAKELSANVEYFVIDI